MLQLRRCRRNIINGKPGLLFLAESTESFPRTSFDLSMVFNLKKGAVILCCCRHGHTLIQLGRIDMTDGSMKIN